ncbi:NUDIX hydrolase [Rhizobium sp. S163]|uniref:NUDIX hydrolase n=1 Tax=Rhizobium sp. S163 TaxID=3055039 RepID=UPI0025A9A31C|nr:NUDIX hydrolase [Rhizobium sp. S163]MDM9648680.1 NUDIX hydrolase [Rhizobium sp. S163]
MAILHGIVRLLPARMVKALGGSRHHIEQAGAICYRRAVSGIEILLIGSRRNGRWGIPKGGIDKGERPWHAAAREAFEEIGALGTCEMEPVSHFFYAKARKHVPTRVSVFMLEVGAMATSFPEKGQRASMWVTVEDASEYVWNDGLRDIILGLPEALKRRAAVVEGRPPMLSASNGKG